MGAAGLWMLALVAVLMIATGLPAWVLLIAVALVFSAGGIAAGIFTLPLLTAVPSRMLGLLENDLLQALPLYVFMGALLNRLPLAETLFRAGSRALAWTGCGVPLAGLGLGVLLAPMNGSVGASVATLTRTVQPRLDAHGVAPERGAALVCVASTLGVVIPPSLVLILLGDAMLRAHTEALNATVTAAGQAVDRSVRIVNTQDVFHGALVPAAILLLLFVIVTWWMDRPAAAGRASDRALADAPARGDWLVAVTATLVIAALLGAVTLGYLYAVEAAATGAMALFLFGLATRTLTRNALQAALRDTMAITGALFALLIAATVFTLVLRAFETDHWLAAILAAQGGGTYGALALVLLILGLCALVLDAFEMIFVVIPLVIPPLLMRVPDAPWVAVLTLLILQASFLIPPFGYAILMVRSRTAHHLDTGKLARALLPYLAAQLLVLALVLAFPRLVWHESRAETAPSSPLAPLSQIKWARFNILSAGLIGAVVCGIPAFMDTFEGGQ
jgi:tripartite ATP-independent transporter DctM subunit